MLTTYPVFLNITGCADIGAEHVLHLGFHENEITLDVEQFRCYSEDFAQTNFTGQPAQPTGMFLDPAVLLETAVIPCPFVIDEAYVEFATSRLGCFR